MLSSNMGLERISIETNSPGTINARTVNSVYLNLQIN